MKICHVVFSSNRIDYLKKTLESHKRLDYCGFSVDRLLIDDYPLGRNENVFFEIAKNYSIDKLILNKENLGITRNWQKLFDIVNNKDYDFILHQEDDVELLYDLKLTSLIDILQSDRKIRQVQLKRNNWYKHEVKEIKAENTDVVFKNYRYEKTIDYFWMMFSLYPSWICREPIAESTGNYPSEHSISQYLNKEYGLYTALLKNENGGIMINHFGEFFQGKRCHESESYWPKFKEIDPTKKYNSINGKLIE
jgi:hypothetical protein